jgi:hypothetical protein
MTAPECFVEAWHPWDGKPVEVPGFDPTLPRQRVIRDGAECFVLADDLLVAVL